MHVLLTKMGFDIYHPGDYAEFFDALKVGVTVELDGIDGFFDQYFEARSPGDVIRFVPIHEPRPFSFVPTDIGAFDSLPIAEAEIESCNAISGTVILRSIESFIPWMLGLPVDSVTHQGDEIEEIDHLLDAIPEYSAHLPFYWYRTPDEISRSLKSEVTALFGLPVDGGFRIAVLTSNALRSWIVSRQNQGE